MSRERNDELYPLVASGDKKAMDEMIEGNMKLVSYKVKAFLTKNPEFEHLEDDLTATGNLALVKAVNSMSKAGPISNANPSGYLSTAVQHSILAMVNVECETRETEMLEEPEDGDGTNLLDRILACAMSETEKQIVLLRSEGATDAEISTRLGVSASSVQRSRKQVEARFNVSA